MAVFQEAVSWMKDVVEALSHGRRPYSAMERTAREATNDEPWGPHGQVLQRLAAGVSESRARDDALRVLDERLAAPPAHWRQVYKSLLVAEHLLQRGDAACARRVLHWLPEAGRLERLTEFVHIDAAGRDQGINVRHKAKSLATLLSNPDLLQAARDKAAIKQWGIASNGAKAGAAAGGSNGVRAVSSGGGAGGGGRSMEGQAGSVGHRRGTHAGEEHERTSIDRGRGPGGVPVPAVEAGQTKGVSKAQNALHLHALELLLQRPANRACADCMGAVQSAWASVSCGVFLCMRCAGVHRGLGVHISAVRSCSLDVWTAEQVAFMAVTGNDVANCFWEARMPADFPRPGGPNIEGKPPPALDAFIARKYARRAFAATDAAAASWPPAAPADWRAAVTAHQAETARLVAAAGGGPAPAATSALDDDWGDFSGPAAAPPAGAPVGAPSLIDF